MRPAKSPNDMPSQADIAALSGLEYMQAIRDGVHAGPPIAASLNMQSIEVFDGEVSFTGTPEFAHCNPLGTVHGGWYGAILDSCMTCAVTTKVPKGYYCTTLEYKVNINRVIPIGMQVRATAVVDHAGRTTATAHGEIRGVKDGKLYATGSTTCMTIEIAAAGG